MAARAGSRHRPGAAPRRPRAQLDRRPRGRCRRLVERARRLCRFRAAGDVAGMSDVAIAGRPGAEGTFRPATMLLVVAIGILAFVAMLVLGAYAPDMRSEHNGGTH